LPWSAGLRLLELHVDFIEYRPLRKEAAVVEEASQEAVRVEDALVLLTSVEPEDDERVAEAAVSDAVEFMQRLKVPRLVIYPFAHLSKELARPEHALEVLRSMEGAARKMGVEVHRSPFGWNKQLSLSVKGHPLAERSRVFNQSSLGAVQQAAAKKTYYLYTQDGRLLQPSEIDGLDVDKASGPWLRRRL